MATCTLGLGHPHGIGTGDPGWGQEKGSNGWDKGCMPMRQGSGERASTASQGKERVGTIPKQGRAKGGRWQEEPKEEGTAWNGKLL